VAQHLPQFAHRLRRHDAGIETPVLQKLGNAFGVPPVTLASLQRFDLRRIHRVLVKIHAATEAVFYV
jgi:hypothetical protein